MFESVAPETSQTRSKKVLYETLPVSLAIHGLAIAAVVLSTLWDVVFPLQSPRLIRPYSLVTVPDPPPPPAPPPSPKPQPAAPLPPPPPEQAVAPTVIPDLIPQVEPPTQVASIARATDGPPPALPGGSPDGQIGGDIGGKVHGTPGGIAFPEDGRVHIDRNKQLPLQVVSQDYPRYPDEAKKKQLEDQVVVRYIIGKNGRVLQVEIIDHAKDPSFDEATVEAIRGWRFRPMIKDGKPIEVVHELAVNFELIRH